MPMRRESSTVVVLVGEVGDGLLAGLARYANVSVTRAPAADAEQASQATAVRPGWEPGALAMREAVRRTSTYVIVPDDPLAGVAAGWRAMWDPPAGPGGAAGFEERAADALAAWRDKRFDLPDYYLVTMPAQLDSDHIPTARAVADVIAEALGGLAAALAPPDQWRITLTLGYAEQMIATEIFTPGQAEAVRQRIRRGV